MSIGTLIDSIDQLFSLKSLNEWAECEPLVEPGRPLRGARYPFAKMSPHRFRPKLTLSYYYYYHTLN